MCSTVHDADTLRCQDMEKHRQMLAVHHEMLAVHQRHRKLVKDLEAEMYNVKRFRKLNTVLNEANQRLHERNKATQSELERAHVDHKASLAVSNRR